MIAPSDPLHLTQFVEQAYARRGPVYIRLGRGNDPIAPRDRAAEIPAAVPLVAFDLGHALTVQAAPGQLGNRRKPLTQIRLERL